MRLLVTVTLSALLATSGASPLERRQLGKGKEGKLSTPKLGGGNGISAIVGNVLNSKWFRFLLQFTVN
jgi:hypothetical protein